MLFAQLNLGKLNKIKNGATNFGPILLVSITEKYVVSSFETEWIMGSLYPSPLNTRLGSVAEFELVT